MGRVHWGINYGNVDTLRIEGSYVVADVPDLNVVRR